MSQPVPCPREGLSRFFTMSGVRETPLGRRESGARLRTINCECKFYHSTYAIISNSNPGLFSHTERTGLLSLTWCSVQPPIVVIGSVSIYNTRKRSGKVCGLPDFLFIRHPTLYMFKRALGVGRAKPTYTYNRGIGSSW